jgi:hypothetical protein
MISCAKSPGNKKKVGKLNFIKTKNFCVSKATINKGTQQHTEWHKIFANHVSDKGLVNNIQNKTL